MGRVLLYCRTIELCFYVLVAKTKLSESLCVCVVVVKLIHVRRYSRMWWHVISFEICSTFQVLGISAKQFREAGLRFFMSLCTSFRRLSACPHGTTRFPRKDVPDSRHSGFLLKLSTRPNCRWNLTKITDAFYDGLTNILLMITFITKFYRFYHFCYFSCVDLHYKGDLSYKIYIVARFQSLSEDTRRLSLCGH